MIEIIHKNTGKVLKRVEAGSLSGADLTDADLSGADLHGADLTGAYLTGADLTSADLIDANLSGAILSGAILTGANLIDANLSGAILSGATLGGATLIDANLSGATLIEANLSGAILSGADLSRARIAWTTFTFCDDIHAARSLELVSHSGPSSLDHHTLRASVCKLPDTFLQGVGYTREEIENLRALYTDAAIRYYSCFLSHTKADADFTGRLRNDLLANNVSCWHYRFDIPTGEYWRERISDAIRVYDKLLLVCSEDSLMRDGVVEEIIEAMEYQDVPKGKPEKKLFPVRIDDFVFDKRLDAFAKAKVAKGDWKKDWLSKIRAIQMADFRLWKDHDAYKSAFDRLLRDLKNSGGSV